MGGDGRLYEGRGWNVVGAHTQGYNSVGYAVSFIGNFMDVAPTSAAVNTYYSYLDVSQVIIIYSIL